MKRLTRWLQCLALFATVLLPALAADKPTIVLISGEYEYKSAQTLPEFKKYLEANFPVNCIYLQRPAATNEQTIPGLEALEKADLVVLFSRRMTLPEAELARFKAYVKSGKPIVGIRTASHSFENWKEFDAEVLGGNYGRHLQKDLKTTVTIAPQAGQHPILEGVAGFVSNGSLYRNSPLKSGTTPLLIGKISSGDTHPVAWTFQPNGARVFYTSLGHQDDFKEESFRRLLVNGIFWALNAPQRIQLDPGVKRVGVDLFEKVWRANRPVLLDVRTPEEFAAGHIPGATNIDIRGKDFASKIKALDPTKEYLVYCAGGVRSAKACEQMEKLKFTNVLDLGPGFNGWSQAGKPVEK
ncbi:MAG TPA: ThuA domain-containing protein [Methylomirabilota bacterium]|nr:ThuA domain-containing protein [Methylomirabilota bacterium]